ncbi:MAG: AbrB/MazE/SpoVT family DNA-binding domain-containing protein [Burkholderiaceae bacterium]|jgi:AbrB family looped-hinge helix DNA binding protein|nr:AbrB/MazE/SpoVT family DNA-binding domain-containing protein [Burkholderiaceae bacterium]
MATLTSKGQITVPVSVRAALGLNTGARVDFVAEGDGFKVVPVRNKVSSLKGRFAHRAARPVSLAAMDRAIGQAAAKRHGGLS